MSDRFTNPGNGGDGDFYKYSGDGQQNLPAQLRGDNYRFDGSNQSLSNEQEQYDCFGDSRMPGRRQPRPEDFKHHYVQRTEMPDGTVIINNVYCNIARFDQRSSKGGADYRCQGQEKYDFRDSDPSLARLRNNRSYYDNNDYCPPELQRRDYREDQAIAMRQMQQEQTARRQYEQEAQRQQQIEMAQRRDLDQAMQRQQQIEQAQRRDYEQAMYRQQQIMEADRQRALEIQMYNAQCRQYNGGDARRELPYYVNDGCFGDGRRNARYNDPYEGGYGGPYFGNRNGIQIRIPIGHNGGNIRIGLG